MKQVLDEIVMFGMKMVLDELVFYPTGISNRMLRVQQFFHGVMPLPPSFPP